MTGVVNSMSRNKANHKSVANAARCKRGDTMTERKECCELCKFFEFLTEEDDEEAGYCHFYPPKQRLLLETRPHNPLIIPDLQIHSRHPMLSCRDFCGQFKKK